MDINLQFWREEGQSFLRRLHQWTAILDPVSLLSSVDEIEKARSLLESEDQKNKREVHNALKLSLTSVHSDTGAIHPAVFRPPAFLPVAAPLVLASLLPHKGVKSALFWQFLLQSYSAGFNFSHRNATASKEKNMTTKQALLVLGAVSYATCAGALPQFIATRYGLRSLPIQAFCRSVLPVPLAALLAAFNVLVVRGEELNNGIRVFDSSGNTVGFSQNAGIQAVNDTALSRAALIGTSAAVPSLFVALLKRMGVLQKRPLLVAPVRHISTLLVFGLMVPISFSLFPQLCTIKKGDLETELQAAAADEELFFHRGL